MTESVRFEREDKIGVLKIDYPPVNALSAAVRDGLFHGLKRAEDDGVEAIVLIGEGRTFPAGADIKEFGKPLQGCPLNEVIAAIEGVAVPVVAAIHGTALGGGLETALACDYRIAGATAKVGLPEVNLGLLPGAGGTQRLPRLTGPEAALHAMVQGVPMGAAKALKLGVIDRISERELLEEAVTWAKEIVAEGAGKRRVRDLPCPTLSSEERAGLAAFVHARAAGQTAPARILKCVEAAMDSPDFDTGLGRERALFAECMEDPQREAMIHAFFGERTSAKVPGISREMGKRSIERAVVIGAGTMGRGIAMCFANAGHQVTLVDTKEASLEVAEKSMDGTYARAVARGKVNEAEAAARRGRIATALNLEAVTEAQLVVEAVFEDMGLKKKIFAELDALAAPGTLLATNTSTLNIDEIASVTSRPQDVLGMHFFSPAHAMRLLEVVRGEETSLEAIASAMRIGKALGKVSVLAGNCHGFIGNRMLEGYLREAGFLLEEGATPAQVDAAITGFGFAMGPFAMQDLAGLDVGWRSRKESGIPKGVRYSPVSDRLCEADRFGQKTSAGYYRYEEGSRRPIEDPEVLDLVRRVAEEQGVEARDISDEEIVDRCVLALVSEGARILEEGIALRASDLDVVYVHGYGFPRWRGGPMLYADQRGLPEVCARMREFESKHGPTWSVPPMMDGHVAEGRGFNR